MPHFGENSRAGGFAILGAGGAWWRDSWDATPTYFWGAHHDDDLAFQLTLGGGYRLNTHAAFEARFTHSSFTTQASHPPRGIGGIMSARASPFGSSWPSPPFVVQQKHEPATAPRFPP
jgi:hypothetical protein